MSVQTEERVQITTTEPTAANRPGRPGVWQRVRQTVAEMNYASRRMIEVKPGEQPR
jgi:hypothetical protein